jgi:hypothetical protein
LAVVLPPVFQYVQSALKAMEHSCHFCQYAHGGEFLKIYLIDRHGICLRIANGSLVHSGLLYK